MALAIGRTVKKSIKAVQEFQESRKRERRSLFRQQLINLFSDLSCFMGIGTLHVVPQII
jgi:hypothetical protein